jgi:hypothetical protein
MPSASRITELALQCWIGCTKASEPAAQSGVLDATAEPLPAWLLVMVLVHLLRFVVASLVEHTALIRFQFFVCKVLLLINILRQPLLG